METFLAIFLYLVVIGGAVMALAGALDRWLP